MTKSFWFSPAIATVLFATIKVEAATCSCAGVPLSNSVSINQFDQRKFRIGFTYTQIDISDLVSGSKDINDETGRKRKTDSYLFQGTYGINEYWAVTGIVSWIQHTRNIAISDISDEVSSGLGDSLFILSYAPQKIDPFTRDEWAMGIGLRIPTGKNNNGSPITFAEDLQPGQGAWGKSFWVHYGHAFSQKADWLAFIDANYISVAENDRDYSFQDEWNINVGTGYRISSPWHVILALNYRNANPHTRFGSRIPNTGGRWLDVSSTVQYNLSEKSSIGLTAKLPIYRNLNGVLQFTTKYSVSVSANYLFD